jgi:DNA-binding response OmpR family regulator
MRILIVDDEKPIAELLGRTCTFDGHAVQTFTSSVEALLCLATEPIDLLITDLHMPAPDGPAVIREARRLQPDIFTLVITGHAGQYAIDDILATGVADVLFKPFHMNELRARVALAERQLSLVRHLRQQRSDLERVSNEMIDGLQCELSALRQRD